MIPKKKTASPEWKTQQREDKTLSASDEMTLHATILDMLSSDSW